MAAARRVEMDARRSGALDEESHLGMDQAKKKNKMEKRAKTKGHHATGGIGREQGGWGMDREGEAKNEWCGRREGDGHARQAGGGEKSNDDGGPGTALHCVTHQTKGKRGPTGRVDNGPEDGPVRRQTRRPATRGRSLRNKTRRWW